MWMTSHSKPKVDKSFAASSLDVGMELGFGSNPWMPQKMLSMATLETLYVLCMFKNNKVEDNLHIFINLQAGHLLVIQIDGLI
jgi:hypothetical protein